MKKILFLSILSVLFFSCGNSDNNKESTTIEKTYVKVLSYNDFIKKIWDVEMNANEFVFKGNKPCVIDFYATWCGPCKKIAPTIEKLAKEYYGKVDFYKVDIDQNQKLSIILQIMNIPTVLFMKAGMQPEKSVGAKDEAYYREIIEKMLRE